MVTRLIQFGRSFEAAIGEGEVTMAMENVGHRSVECGRWSGG